MLHGETCSPELGDNTVITDEMAGADNDQVVAVSVSETFYFRHPS